MILTSENKNNLEEVKQKLLIKFEIKGLTDLINGMMFLEINITKRENGLILNQTDLIDEFKLTEEKPTNVCVEPELKLSRHY